MVADARGTEVRYDSLVEGLVGSLDVVKARGRVYYISPHGWVGVWTESARQVVFGVNRFLIRGDPRPEKQRTDVPDRLRR